MVLKDSATPDHVTVAPGSLKDGQDLIARAADSQQPEQPRHRESEPADIWLSIQTPGSIVNRHAVAIIAWYYRAYQRSRSGAGSSSAGSWRYLIST
jgi:hypothetical protein